MGLRLAALEGAEFDAIVHLTPAIGRVRPAQPRGRPARRARLARRALHAPDRRPTTTPPSGATADVVPRRRVRILHTSDLHVGDSLGRDRRRSAPWSTWRWPTTWTSCCSSATSSTTTGSTTEIGQALVDELRRLAVPVVVLPGNHDCLVPDTIYERVDDARPRPRDHRRRRARRRPRRARPRDLGQARTRATTTSARSAGLPPRGRADVAGGAGPRPARAGPDDLRRAYLITPEEIAASGARLRRPRPLGRAARHERRDGGGVVLRVGQPQGRVRARHADARRRASAACTCGRSASTTGSRSVHGRPAAARRGHPLLTATPYRLRLVSVRVARDGWEQEGTACTSLTGTSAPRPAP